MVGMPILRNQTILHQNKSKKPLVLNSLDENILLGNKNNITLNKTILSSQEECHSMCLNNQPAINLIYHMLIAN